MTTTEFICAISFCLALGTYCALIIWSPFGKRFAKHEPPAHLRPILQFWGLTADADGYARMSRTSAWMLLVLAAFYIALATWQFIN